MCTPITVVLHALLAIFFQALCIGVLARYLISDPDGKV